MRIPYDDTPKALRPNRGQPKVPAAQGFQRDRDQANLYWPRFLHLRVKSQPSRPRKMTTAAVPNIANAPCLSQRLLENQQSGTPERWPRLL